MAPAGERTDPPGLADERTMLVTFLDYYRASLIMKAEGLDDDQARTASVSPSDLTIMGLVRHMAEVERSWFQRWMAGQDLPPLFFGESHPTGDPDGDLHPDADATLSDALTAWADEVTASDAVIASIDSMDQASVLERDGWRPNLRWVMVHMIEEYARHCGHADLIRERIDGVTGD